MENCNVDAQLHSLTNASAEVLHKLVDDQAIAITRSVPAGVDWKSLPSMLRHVSRIHGLVNGLGLADYFNYHMDMLERDDLVLLN